MFYPQFNYTCNFGSTEVVADYISDTEVHCISPPYSTSKRDTLATLPVYLSAGGKPYTYSYPFDIIGNAFYMLPLISQIAILHKMLACIALTALPTEIPDVTGVQVTVSVPLTTNAILNHSMQRFLQNVHVSKKKMRNTNFEALLSIYPTSGPQTGGTEISIMGSNFVNTSLACSFNSGTVVQQVPGRYLNITTIICITPASNISGNTFVNVVANSKALSQTPLAFTFTNGKILFLQFQVENQLEIPTPILGSSSKAILSTAGIIGIIIALVALLFVLGNVKITHNGLIPQLPLFSSFSNATRTSNRRKSSWNLIMLSLHLVLHFLPIPIARAKQKVSIASKW
jgi:hypothetical protein